jgi:hypothetical protein
LRRNIIDPIYIGLEGTRDKMTAETIVEYLKTFVGVPYRWHRAGDDITGDEPFWAAEEGVVTREYIDAHDKSIVCTGLANLARRYLGLSIPGLDGSLEHVLGKKYPGTTGTWFAYLEQKGALNPLDVNANYPVGSLLLRDFYNVHSDQGHIAIVAGVEGATILEQTILHAFAVLPYEGSETVKNVGQTALEPFAVSHNWIPEGYYTHVCMPQGWLEE